MTDPGQGIWVYAIGMRVDSDLLAGMTGVAGEEVRVVAVADLVAVVGTVALADFGEGALQQDLADVQRLGTIARAHHRVVESVAQYIPVVPARLATIFGDDDRVRGMLTKREQDLKAALARVSGRQEWGVKGYVADTPTPVRGTAKPGSGKDYLLQRQASLRAGEEARRAASAAGAQLHRRLSAAAVDARWQAAQDPHLSGERASMVLNGAYLVDKDSSVAFGELVQELAQQQPSLRLQLTGPWPPYSFTTTEESVTADRGPKHERGPDDG